MKHPIQREPVSVFFQFLLNLFFDRGIDLVSAQCLHFRIYLVGFVNSAVQGLKIYLVNAISSNASQWNLA